MHFLGDSPTLQPPDPPPAEIATARYKCSLRCSGFANLVL